MSQNGEHAYYTTKEAKGRANNEAVTAIAFGTAMIVVGGLSYFIIPAFVSDINSCNFFQGVAAGAAILGAMYGAIYLHIVFSGGRDKALAIMLKSEEGRRLLACGDTLEQYMDGLTQLGKKGAELESALTELSGFDWPQMMSIKPGESEANFGIVKMNISGSLHRLVLNPYKEGLEEHAADLAKRQREYLDKIRRKHQIPENAKATT
ncbi:MAG: hypothetical protein ABIA47_00125 [bacterium]